MEYLRIGVDDDAKGITEQILEFIKVEKNDAIEYKYRKNTKKTKFNYLDIFFKTKFSENLKLQIGVLISEWIVKKYENQMLYKIVNKKHGNLSKKEKEKVLINAIEKNENEKTYKIDKRKNEIKNEISTYLETSNQIFIDGFIRFRLKEYFLHLEEIVEDSVKDYKIDKEYNGFIRLLQYFIKIQPSKLNVLHIVAKKNGTYNFYNKFLLNINNECKENLEEEILTNQINYDDFLISTVIVLSPKKIILHRSDIIKNKELISTLDKIFENKIKFCDGCNLCENDKI